MPLDARNQDLPRFCSMTGASGFVIEPDRLRSISGADLDVRSRAGASYSVWQALCVFEDAGLAILKGNRRFSIVQRLGGVIVEAVKPINVGLLRMAMSNSDPVDVAPVFKVDWSGFDAMQRVVWALAKRIDRVEADRRFELKVGVENYALQADADGFSIIDQEGGTDRLRAKLEEAVAQHGQVEFTFGEPVASNATSRHVPQDLLAPIIDTGLAEFRPNGWPLTIPAGVSFEKLQAIMCVVQTMSAEGVSEIDLRTAMGLKLLRIAVSGDGEGFTVEL